MNDDTIVRPYDHVDDVRPGDVVSIWNFAGSEFTGLVVYVYERLHDPLSLIDDFRVIGVILEGGELRDLRSYSIDVHCVRHIAVKKNKKRK